MANVSWSLCTEADVEISSKAPWSATRDSHAEVSSKAPRSATDSVWRSEHAAEPHVRYFGFDELLTYVFVNKTFVSCVYHLIIIFPCVHNVLGKRAYTSSWRAYCMWIFIRTSHPGVAHMHKGVGDMENMFALHMVCVWCGCLLCGVCGCVCVCMIGGLGGRGHKTSI